MMSSEQSYSIPVDAYQTTHSLATHSLERPGHVSPLANQSCFRSGNSGAQIQEIQLVQDIRNGDEAAFNTLIERYHGQLLRLARSFVHTQAIAEEVVQETWLAVLQGITRFEGRSSLKTWIFKILTNRAKTKGQRESRYVSFSDAASLTDQEKDLAMEPERFHTSGPQSGHWAIPPTTWDEHTPERLLMSKESLAQIEKAIHTLPSNQRQVIILRDIEGVDSEEISQILNITSTNQRVLLHRARSKIRQVLEEHLEKPLTQCISSHHPRNLSS